MRKQEAERLIDEARAILDRVDRQKRDLSDFEAGRVDALLELARRSGASGYVTRQMSAMPSRGSQRR